MGPASIGAGDASRGGRDVNAHDDAATSGNLLTLGLVNTVCKVMRVHDRDRNANRVDQSCGFSSDHHGNEDN